MKAGLVQGALLNLGLVLETNRTTKTFGQQDSQKSRSKTRNFTDNASCLRHTSTAGEPVSKGGLGTVQEALWPWQTCILSRISQVEGPPALAGYPPHPAPFYSPGQYI